MGIFELELLDRSREFDDFIVIEFRSGMVGKSGLYGNKQCWNSESCQHQFVGRSHSKYPPSENDCNFCVV